MLMIYVFLIVMSTIIGGVGGLGLMTTMSLNVLERRLFGAAVELSPFTLRTALLPIRAQLAAVALR